MVIANILEEHPEYMEGYMMVFKATPDKAQAASQY